MSGGVLTQLPKPMISLHKVFTNSVNDCPFYLKVVPGHRKPIRVFKKAMPCKGYDPEFQWLSYGRFSDTPLVKTSGKE